MVWFRLIMLYFAGQQFKILPLNPLAMFIEKDKGGNEEEKAEVVSGKDFFHL